MGRATGSNNEGGGKVDERMRVTMTDLEEPVVKEDEYGIDGDARQVVRKRSEEIKNFLIKLGTVSVVVVVLYFIFSPYQNCVRTSYGPERDEYHRQECIKRTDW